MSIITFLRALGAMRFGTLKGNERNVHYRKAGPGRMPQNRGRPKKPGRLTKVHRRIASGPGSLVQYDQDMSDYLLLKALDQPCKRPARRVESVRTTRA